MKINPIYIHSCQRNLYRCNKTNNNVSFEKNMDELIYPFGYDIIKYTIQTKKPKLKEVEKIVQKYSPDTKVEDMKKHTTLGNYKGVAYTDIEFEQIEDERGIYLKTLPLKMYLRPPYGNSQVQIGFFLAETIHEMTHVFQQESDDRLSYEELFDRYFKNCDNQDEVLATILLSNELFDIITCKVKDLDLAEDLIHKILRGFISAHKKEDINFDLLIDSCILRARNEEEAYENMLNFEPGLVISGSIIKTKIEINSKIADVLSKIRQLNNISADAQD